jgi:tRNA-Thr(GGU) m(6)t(6)A37 methyltransferase TsaA
MNRLEVKPIGTIHSPFFTPQGMPIQASGAKGIHGTVEVFPEYAQGLDDLSGFSHLHLIYFFHLAKPFALKVKPFLDEVERGLFATRAPSRPNPIGLSVVRLLKIESRLLHVEDIDVVDGTPLLDIKPYVPEFDVREADRIGWLGAVRNRAEETCSDNRFAKE